jgi:hypothetical protein
MHMLHQVHILICLVLKIEEINTVSQQKFSLHINCKIQTSGVGTCIEFVGFEVHSIGLVPGVTSVHFVRTMPLSQSSKNLFFAICSYPSPAMQVEVTVAR